MDINRVSPGVSRKQPFKMYIPPSPTRGQLTALADQFLGAGARSERIRNEHIQGAPLEIRAGMDARLGDGADAHARPCRRGARGLGREGWAALCVLYAGRDRLAVLFSAILGPDQTHKISERMGCTERSVRNAQARVLLWVRSHYDRNAVRQVAGTVDPDDPSLASEARRLHAASGVKQHQLSFDFYGRPHDGLY